MVDLQMNTTVTMKNANTITELVDNVFTAKVFCRTDNTVSWTDICRESSTSIW